MKKSKFTEEQIVCPPRGRKRTAPGRCLSAARGQRSHVLHLEEEIRASRRQRAAQLRSLEDENARLKRLVADLSLDKHILTEALRKKG